MKKYFINETETFAINTPLDARVELMGWEKIPIVYVDNFYKNPNMVRNLAIRCPGTNNPRVCGGVPGVRVDMNMNLDHMWSVWMEIADSVWGVTKEERKNFEIACMQVPFSVNVIPRRYLLLRPVKQLYVLTSCAWFFLRRTLPRSPSPRMLWQN